MDAQQHSCLSCRYYVLKTATVGILFTNGKGWKFVAEMGCEQHAPAVEHLGPCSAYEREPGAD